MVGRSFCLGALEVNVLMFGLEGILVGLVAALGAVIAAYMKGRSSGKKEAQGDALKDTAERLQKGRDAVRDGRDGDPADRLRDNDAKW